MVVIITTNKDNVTYTTPHYGDLVGKPEGKTSLGRPRHRWENYINILLQGRGWEDMDLIHVAQDRDKWQDFVNRVINFQAA
jgi:hypothetical protein